MGLKGAVVLGEGGRSKHRRSEAEPSDEERSEATESRAAGAFERVTPIAAHPISVPPHQSDTRIIAPRRPPNGMSKSFEELQDLADREVGEADADREPEPDDSPPDARRTRKRGGILGRSPVTLRGFLVAFAVCVAGLVVGGAMPLVGGLTRYLGLAVGTFLLGLLRPRRAYLEVGAAGALSATGVFLLGVLTGGGLLLGTNLVAEFGLSAAAAGVGVGVGVGLVLSLLGYYLGRDLRDGLTRDV